MNLRISIAFEIQPGNIPDINTIDSMIARCNSLGINSYELVLDNGYVSNESFAKMSSKGLTFISMSKMSTSWVKKHLQSV